jgi:hypothetical protein
MRRTTTTTLSLVSLVPILLVCACTQQNFDFKAVEALNGLSTPTLLINDGAVFTNNLGVQLTTKSPDTRLMKISNADDCEKGTAWIDQNERVQWTLSTENSKNSVYAKFRSRNGYETDCVVASIVHDNKNPLVDIIERPADLTNTNVSRFRFAGLDDGSGIDYFECQLSSGTFIGCPPTSVFSGLVDGIHNMQVRAVDRAGNRSEIKDAQWLIDTRPPDVRVTQGPPAVSSSSSATFIFDVDDHNGSGIERVYCRLGPIVIDPCTSPLFIPSLSQGTYNFQLWATDRANHTSNVLTYTWVVDNIPSGEFAIVGVDQPPADTIIDGWLRGVTPRVHWSNSTGASHYLVSLLSMSGAIVCGEQTSTSLNYTFPSSCVLNDLTSYRAKVTAVDSAGNSRTNNFVFVTDLSPPIITIQPAVLSGDQKQATLNFMVSDTAPGVLRSITCSLTQLENGVLRTVQQACSGLTTLVFSNQPLGDHKFKVVADDLAGNVAEKEVTWTTRQVICDPFTTDISACRGGLVGEIFYLNQEQQGRFRALPQKTVEFFFTDGIKLNAIINLMNLFGTTRRFNLGFPTADGNLVKDDQGNTLVEYFAFKLKTLVLLDVDNADTNLRDQPGLYQFATISDDGTRVFFQPVIGGPFTQIINNDGDHSTRMGCATQLVNMQPETRLPLNLDYYQGPRDYIALTLVWRKVTNNDLNDPLCGQGGSSLFFGPYPHDDFTNAYGFGQLRERGWKVLGGRNFIAPQ